MSQVPRFAVVGRVNKGKSSIVATLAEDDAILIDPRPGTTRDVQEYPVRVDGRTLFSLLDTPGFEDAPRALAWLRAREGTAASTSPEPLSAAKFSATNVSPASASSGEGGRSPPPLMATAGIPSSASALACPMAGDNMLSP